MPPGCWASAASHGAGSRPGDAQCHWAEPGTSADLWDCYLPYLYSCLSLLGVLLLLCESSAVPSCPPAPWGPSGSGWVLRHRAEPPVPTQDPSKGTGEGCCAPHALLSLSSHRSLHPLWPLHHVYRHRQAAGEAQGKLCPLTWAHCPTLGGSQSLPSLPAWALGAIPIPLTHPQLLEDLDEQLSCTRLEEAAVSHRISSGGYPAQLLAGSWGAQG